jgi:TFIIF-interacting CTD phosphatase-like protein
VSHCYYVYVCLITLPDIVADITKWTSVAISLHSASLPTVLDLLSMYLTGDICYYLKQVGGRDVDSIKI